MIEPIKAIEWIGILKLNRGKNLLCSLVALTVILSMSLNSCKDEGYVLTEYQTLQKD